MPHNATARLAIIAVVALGIRLVTASAFVGLEAPPRATAQPDQVDYEDLAWALAADGRYSWPDGSLTAYRPPGTPLALLPVYAVVGRSYAAGRVWFCVIGAVTCLITGLLAHVVFRSERAALAAAAILAVYPGHFYYSLHFVSEVPYGLWLALALWLVLSPTSSTTGRSARDIGAGLAIGLATLTRPQLLFVLPLVALAVGVARPRRSIMTRAAVVAVAFAVSLAPWVVRNVLIMQRATLSTLGGHTFWGANNAVVLAPDLVGQWVPTSDLADAAHPLDGTEVENEAAAWRYGLAFVRDHLGEMPRLLAWKLIRLLTPFEATENRAVYWAFAVSWIVVAPLMLFGISALRDRRFELVALILPLAATVVMALVFYGSVRFRDSNAPILACLAGGGVATLLRRGAPNSA